MTAITRKAHLKEQLNTRRYEMQRDVRERIRDGRTDRLSEVGDDLEQSDAGIQSGIELALLGMRAAALVRADEALVRLDAGEYGACIGCGGKIAARRLRALPFAVRCHACEEKLEQEQEDARRTAERRGTASRFTEAVSS